MKKALLLFTAIMLLVSTYAQDTKEKQPTTFGLVGAANLAKFNVGGTNAAGLDYEFKTDFNAGFYFNIPISQRFSFEPQFLFIANKLKPKTAAPNAFSGKMNYFGIPLLLKVHAGKYISFPVGVQIDFLTNVNDDANLLEPRNFESYSFGPTAGIEITPISRISIFGRYIHGLNTVNLGPDNKPYEYKNQNIYAGLKIKLFDFRKKVVIPPPPPPPVDTDRDGIIDSLDKCPTVPGIAKYDGCPIPDTDKDGINDEEDKCPTVPGLAKYQGCPIPDTDKDGINDEEDKCPTVPGVKEYQGCPVPDRDKDGIPDDVDKCPDVPGVASQQGCPEITEEVVQKIEYAAKKIFFNTASTKLLTKSYPALNDVVKLLNENMSVKLSIAGHTDNQGSDEYNQKLSEGRAASVKAYMVSKGIDESRLISEGFGESQPIADNKTAAGRQQNRRVELKLFY
jgi:outer membrane protein OmpA-like peptidoglycan-associated protein